MSNLVRSCLSGTLRIMWTCWIPSSNPTRQTCQGLAQVGFAAIAARAHANHEHSRHVWIRLLPHQQRRQVLNEWELSRLSETHQHHLLRQRISKTSAQC